MSDQPAPSSAGMGKLVGALGGYEIGNEIAHDVIDQLNDWLPHVLNAGGRHLITLLCIGLVVYFVPPDVISKLSQRFTKGN